LQQDLPEPGDAFEHYEIDERIGRGGFGSVYRARDLRLRRAVALKIISLADDNEDRLQRFLREVDLCRKLTHPHSVRVYDYGIDPKRRPYIAFELLEGETLYHRIKHQGRLSPAETRRVAECVLKSLMEAHQLGIVHRDIKPTNVFLSRFAGERDFVKVLDFGIAKSRGRDLTLQGWLIGTPAYMAPEQIVGQNPNPASDLYSLGLVMAQMLTGEAPVRGTGSEILAIQMAPEPVDLPPEILSGPLGHVIRKATQKDLRLRYATAEEMREDLVAAAPDSVQSRRSRGVSVAPVAYTNGGSTPPPVPGRASTVPWLALSIVTCFLLAMIAVLTVAFFPRPAPAVMPSVLTTNDPTLSPGLVALVAEKRGFHITESRQVSANTRDFTFTSAKWVGTIRVESIGSVEEARWFESQLAGPGTRASLRRGRHIASVWALPRGSAAFERSAAESALSALTE
jgi:serine/threonine protein kinase